MADFVKVATTNEIEPGQARLVDVQGKRIALFNIDGTFFALDGTCTHKGGPLAEGEISGHKVTCPGTARGSTFGQGRSLVHRPSKPSRATASA